MLCNSTDIILSQLTENRLVCFTEIIEMTLALTQLHKFAYCLTLFFMHVRHLSVDSDFRNSAIPAS